jgi:hypothetical protein
LPPWPDAAVTSISSNRRSSSRRSRHDVDEGRHLGTQDQVRHRASGCLVRLHDPVGACETELLRGVLVRRARDDEEVGLHGTRRQRDVEVVRVVVRCRDQAAGPLEPGLPQVIVVGAVSLEEQHTFLLGGLLRLRAEVEHDERRAFVPELVGHTPAHATEAADDVVAAQRLDRLSPPPLCQRPADHSTCDRLDQERPDVGKDSDPARTRTIVMIAPSRWAAPCRDR